MPVPASVFRLYQPSAELRPHVCGYMMFTTEGEEPERTEERFFSDGSSETRFHSGDPLLNHMLPGPYPSITFNFGDAWRMQESRPVILPKDSAWAMGATTRVAVCQFGQRAEAFGVMFHAGQSRRFIGAAAEELTDVTCALDQLWGPAAPRLQSQLAEARTAQAKVRVLERELLRRLRASSPREASVQPLARLIEHRRGVVSVDELSQASGVSRQHLTRRFRQQVGVTPKQFCRFTRFHAVVNHVYFRPRVNWADVSAEFGYYDQAHLIAEFKEFTGLTPTQFFRPARPPVSQFAAD